MSEEKDTPAEKENQEQGEKTPAPVPPKKPFVPKKPPFNPFAGKSTNFRSSKAGNPGAKGRFKGGGTKKGS